MGRMPGVLLIHWMYGTAMGRETKDFYKQIPLRQMPYGQAMAMLFLMEAGEEA